MLTRKHYQGIARVIHDNAYMLNESYYGIAESEERRLTRYRIARDLCEYFTADNPRFDSAKFMQACGLGG
jgi:hypothetical protein